MLASGFKKQGKYWKIGIENPALITANQDKNIINSIKLKNTSIATSGSYKNYFEQDNKRYSHLINPKSGKPIQHKTISVSVLNESNAIADAWATAMHIMDHTTAINIANNLDIPILIYYKEGEEIKEESSKSWNKYIKITK